MASVTIYDVAREAGVSMATVSRVVNGNTNVKPTTRKKVLDVIDRLDYRPNAVAQGLASKKTTTIGVIIPDISSIFYGELARGIEDIATMYKYNIILANSDQNKEKELRVLDTMLGKQVDGIVFMGGQITEDHVAAFEKASVPIVLAGSIDTTEKIPSVNINYEQAIYDAVASLIQAGHRKVAIVIGPLSNPVNVHEKLAGYKRALQEEQIRFEEQLVIEGDYTYESGASAMERIWSLEEQPTALFICGDEVALGAVHALQDKGYKVPGDMEIISSDNTRLSLMVRPQLTSIVQPLYDIGAVSMRLLTKYMNKEEVVEHLVVLPHRIEYRNSTK